MHRTIDYVARGFFKWFVKKVTETRRKGDKATELVLLAEIFNLLGKSAYGKLIEAMERQTKVSFTRYETEEHKSLR